MQFCQQEAINHKQNKCTLTQQLNSELICFLNLNLPFKMIIKPLNILKNLFIKTYLQLNSSQKQGSILTLYQHAQVAMQFISEISKSNSDTPLMQRILDIKADEVDTILQKRKSDLFIEGIQIDRQIFSSLQKNKSNQRLFCFYPTSMVALPIFNFINSQKVYKISLIYGVAGISKTSSVLLYYLLSSQINKYLYLCSEAERADFRKKWSQRRVIVPNKLFYWSVELGKNEKDVTELLKRQCPQLNIETKIESIEQLEKLISKAYEKKKICVDVIIDQINKISEIYEEHNKNYYSQKYKLDEMRKKEVSQARKAHGFCSQMKQLSVSNKGNFYITSSVNLSKKIMKEPTSSYMKQQLTLNLLKWRGQLQKLKISYSALNNPSIQIQVDFILAKEIIKRLRAKIVVEKMDSLELTKRITKLRGNSEWGFFVHPQSISQIVASHKFENNTRLLLQPTIKALIEKIKEQSRKILHNKIKDFLYWKQNKERVAILYLSSLEEIKDKKIDINDFPKLTRISHSYISQISIQNELFIYNQDNQTFDVQISLKDFRLLFQLPQFSSIIYDWFRGYQLNNLYNSGKSFSAFGRIVEDSFISFLRDNSHDAIIRIKSDSNRQIVFTIKKVGGFQNFKNMQISNVWNNLKDLIYLSEQNTESFEFVLGLPKTSEGTTCFLPQYIDFMVMNISKGALKILSFQFGSWKEDGRTEQKLNDGYMKKVIESAQLQKDVCKISKRIEKIQWEHRIVVNPLWAKERKEQPSKVNNLYKWTDLSAITIYSGEDSKDRDLFEQGVKLMRQEQKQEKNSS